MCTNIVRTPKYLKSKFRCILLKDIEGKITAQIGNFTIPVYDQKELINGQILELIQRAW